ncbi:MAG: tyrosine--tRNA ligase [Spirochaetia bacterium]|nr:tyrosine--tRNA ligase [Spirochaetia bacterium]
MKTGENIEEIILPNILQKPFEDIIRGCEEILPVNQLKKKLVHSYNNKKPLIIKAGFDPTAPDLHLGHTVLLQKLKVFQDLGHEVNFLIGDYTAMIGDPTGKSETRKPLSAEEVKENAKTYEEQVFKILEKKKTKIIFNSSWLSNMNLKDVLTLTSKYTVARLLERNDFEKRYQEKQPISLVEFMYPLLQGYDSVIMKSDIELGGTDQKFNLLVGRDLQEHYHQEPQVIITLPLLVGLDGENKMSKSLNNYVSIQEPAIEIYGKLLSISDELMWEYYRLLSQKSLEEIDKLKINVKENKIHPKEVKSDFAVEIVARFYDEKTALAAKKEWETIHSPKHRGVPEDIEEFKITKEHLLDNKIGLLNALRMANITSSNGEARRIVESGGVHLLENDEENTITDTTFFLKNGEYLFRIGKRKFIKIFVP